MRHTGDEGRLAHEENNSPLGHEVNPVDDEAILSHIDSSGNPVNQNVDSTDSNTQLSGKAANPTTGPAPAQNPSTDINRVGRLSSKALHVLDQLLPDDRANETTQVIKHDVLETPAAVIEAMNDISDMRQRGQRLFFENKNSKPLSIKNTGSKNEPDLDAVGAKPKGSRKNGKAPSGGKKKDRYMRRALDRGYIATQAAANMLPDEQQEEDSGTKGVRSILSESAKLVKVFATAERKPSKLQHADEEITLVHESVTEENRLEHGESGREQTLLFDDSDGEETTHVRLPEEGTKSNSTLLHPDEITDTVTLEDADIPGEPIPQPKMDSIEKRIDRNIEKLTTRAATLEKKIEKAEAKIPKRKVKKYKLEHDKKSGKDKRKISFADEKIDKADAKWNLGQSKTLTGNSTRYVTGHASTFIHGKVSESENLTGNTGLKAAHSGEKALVKTYQTAVRVRRYMKNAPYRKLQHLKYKEAQNKGKLAYQKLLKDKPELRKNTFSRLLQKRRIKREYAQAFRAAQAGGKAGLFGTVGAVAGVGAAAVSGDGKALAKAGAGLGLRIAFKKTGMALAKAAAPLLLKIGALFLIIAAILLMFAMCVSIIGSALGHLLDAMSYQADMDDITKYSVYMTQLEVELKEEIIEAATDLDGLHEFRLVVNSPSGGTDVVFQGTLTTPGRGHPYNTPPVYSPPDFDPLILLPFLNDITHNPFEVMAYLTAVYGDFEGHDINEVLRELFETAFTLEIVEGFEVRTATVEAWHFNPGGGRIPPLNEIMEYNWYYREVRLTVNMTISQAIQDRMTADQRELFDILMESRGLRQFVGSPFENYWLGNVSSPFGYRFHPITLVRAMHTGIDIGKPEGTPILSGLPGVVAFAGVMGGYGNTVIIEYFDEESGMGVRLLYAHMHEIHVAVGDEMETGGIIGTVGMTGTATGNHLHMEVSINEDGGAWRLINPLFFVQPYKS